jgi:nitrite reductase/ring-hydroxylating ferredoxin subunit|tara:strand:- start:3691 stop:4023 length:333 start_codon:yes stop_codon:yes gene_type:complete
MVAEGQSRGFDPLQLGCDSLFVVRRAGQLYGWRNACPHINGAPMAWRKDAYLDAAGRYIACHAHGALFEPDTGMCIQGPCVGQQLQPVDVSETPDGNIVVVDPLQDNKKE